jgi:hypothetical protein
MLALKATVLAASGLVATWFTALAPEPTDDLFFLVARGSTKCVVQAGATRDNGDRIVQGTCVKRDNFKLRRIPHGDGSFYLQFAHSEKCVNLTGTPSEMLGTEWENGTALTQWECADRSNIRWRATPASDGYVFLMNEASRKCVSLKDGGRKDGEAIIQWECASGRPDMMWKMMPAK